MVTARLDFEAERDHPEDKRKNGGVKNTESDA
jgi:hypothetical protein